ncbi:MAG: hypothetical protein IPN38_13140 [Flavobacteriales bacterium]|nr:hypothetical protein [Flavobacteriales bacterium]
MLFFAALGLFLFALGTQRLLSGHYEQHTNELLEERTRSAGVELHDKLRGEAVLSARMGAYLNHLLSKLSNVFFTDITLYSPDGGLLATSRPQVFNTGLIAPRMDPRSLPSPCGGRGQQLHARGAHRLRTLPHRIRTLPQRPW